MTAEFTGTGFSRAQSGPSGGSIDFNEPTLDVPVSLTDPNNQFNVGDQVTYDENGNTGQIEYVGYVTVDGVNYPVVESAHGLFEAYGVQVSGSEPFTAGPIPCFVAGARIATPGGEVAVENLGVGDLVLTASGSQRPIVWIGHRRLDIRRHLEPAEARPIRVRAHAFGDGLPRRDLWLSPRHCVAWERALIPISALVNGNSVAAIDLDSVEYWHVELDAHDVMLAEGLPAESYLDSGNRTCFANGGAFVEAHPDFKPKHWAETCLPLLTEGPVVAQAKARLLARAGGEIVRDARPHVLADGRRIEPLEASQTRLMFVLPRGAREVALASRTFVPAHVDPESADTRALGLCVSRLQIDGDAIPLHGEGFDEAGWREPEFEDGRFARRWTTGLTPLTSGARIVIVDLGGQGRYWSVAEARALALA